MKGGSPSAPGLWEAQPAGGEELARFLLSFEDTGLVRRIAHYLEEQGCQTALIERRHADEEYFQEYLYFYSTTFRQYPPTTERVHFFASPPERVAGLLVRALPRSAERALGYLGSVVFRPTLNRRVCTTLLAPPKRMWGARVYPHCVTAFPTTVCGRRLSVSAAPFIGQDETGRCAQSALWGGLRYLHRHRYYDKLSMPEITQLVGRESPATTFTRPAEGLADWEMYLVLRATGFQVYYNERPPDGPMNPDPLESIYTTVESGLPAFITLRIQRDQEGAPEGVRHAVWAVAHTLVRQVPDEHRHLAEIACESSGSGDPGPGKPIRYLSRSHWVGHILVHDDNTGPYAPCRTDRTTTCAGGPPQPQYRFVFDNYSKRGLGRTLPRPYSDARVLIDNVITPLPPEVFLKPPEAVAMAVLAVKTDHLRGLCEVAEAELGMPLPTGARRFLSAISQREDRYAFRTFLAPSDCFREHVATCASMCQEAAEVYLRRLQLPEYVWITEITDTEAPGAVARGGVVGEVIVDSTDSAALHTGMGFSYLALHVPGLLVLPDSGEEEYALIPLHSDDRPYSPFTRLVSPVDIARPHRDFGPLGGR